MVPPVLAWWKQWGNEVWRLTGPVSEGKNRGRVRQPVVTGQGVTATVVRRTDHHLIQVPIRLHAASEEFIVETV